MPESVEFWGVFDPTLSALVAFSENIVSASSCFYSTMWFTPDCLPRGASYALIHSMNEYYLVERGLRYVSDGARNISHNTNIHQFLESKFGFRRAYCLLNVVYAPRVAMAVAFLYPFRAVIRKLGMSARVNVLLEQERIRRACAPLVMK